MASIIISTTIPQELHDKAKRANLKWSHALRFGIIKLLKIEQGEDLAGTNADINELREEIKKMQLTMQRHIDARVKLMSEVENLKDANR
jgi:hypothetical protein|tara:strand:+ start:821 stop:1087 length:267 start_codon:yes stop_codon:yes gene_type:complete